MSQPARQSSLTLAVFLAAWIFAAAAPGFAQVRSTVSASATVVDARAGWMTDGEVRAALEAIADPVMLTEQDRPGVIVTADDGLIITARTAGPAPERLPAQSPRREPVRLRVDYSAN